MGRGDLRLLPIVATLGSLVAIFMCSWPRLSLWQLSTPQPAICARRSPTRVQETARCPIVQYIHTMILRKKKKKKKKESTLFALGRIIGQVYERGGREAKAAAAVPYKSMRAAVLCRGLRVLSRARARPLW